MGSGYIGSNPVYKKEKDIKNYNDVEYVAYDKEYDYEALDNDEYDRKNDEIDLIEKHFNVNINVYIHDEPDERSRFSVSKLACASWDHTNCAAGPPSAISGSAQAP